jgi:hypothetical protein
MRARSALKFWVEIDGHRWPIGRRWIKGSTLRGFVGLQLRLWLKRGRRVIEIKPDTRIDSGSCIETEDERIRI